MNMKNENFTPRERVDAEFLRRLLSESDGTMPVMAQHRPTHCPAKNCTRHPGGQNQSSAPQKPAEETCCPTGGPSLAMVYSPYQEFCDLYDAEDGFCRGTVFKQLDKPLQVGNCRERR